VGKVYEELGGRLREFVLAQPVYFVATAPEVGGHVNVSPKGGKGTFVVLGAREVAYLDYTGSGVETIAHLRENGRITIMFCAFGGPPKIVRLSGSGSAVLPGDGRWEEFIAHFAGLPTAGIRSIVVVAVDRIADSCGYSVPYLDYVGERTILWDDHERKGPERLAEYRAERNAASIDGLPGLPAPRADVSLR
jgi:pyridoxamine 5'-phosphate oxidase-like protein